MANAPQLWKQAPKSMEQIDLTPHSTLAGFAAFGRASLWRHIVEPNKAAGILMDFFLHSWHSEIGSQLDAMYQPVASLHEGLRKELNSVKSQHLSLKKSLGLAISYAAKQSKNTTDYAPSSSSASPRVASSLGEGLAFKSSAFSTADVAAATAYYDHFLVMRYDILFFTPLHLGPLDLRVPLWLPHWCHRYPLTAESGMLVRAACGNWPGHGEGYLVHPATTVGVYPPMRKQPITREADYDYSYLDWWFIARPSVAATFADIYDSFEQYHAALQKVARFPTWSHFFWGYHINRRLRLRQSLRYILYEGVDFRLARHWHLGTHCMHFMGGALDGSGGSADGSPGLDAVAGAGVETSIYYRRTSAIRGAPRGRGELPNGTVSTGAQLARQCPLDRRVRIYCPWLSPVCPASLREAVLEAEVAARTAIRASTRLPPWTLFGDARELETARREVMLRRQARHTSGSGQIALHSNLSHQSAAWTLD